MPNKDVGSCITLPKIQLPRIFLFVHAHAHALSRIYSHSSFLSFVLVESHLRSLLLIAPLSSRFPFLHCPTYSSLLPHSIPLFTLLFASRNSGVTLSAYSHQTSSPGTLLFFVCSSFHGLSLQYISAATHHYILGRG